MTKVKPLLIVVSGAPGSGKTTLARKLAAELHLPHLERDLIFDSMKLTAGDAFDRKEQGIPTFYGLVTDALKRDISLVIDGTLYAGISEQDITQFFTVAQVINIHCRTHAADARFEQRELANAQGAAPDWLPELLVRLKTMRPQVIDPLKLDWQTIEVYTTDDYEPSLQVIIAEIHTLVRTNR